jgi:hypothetical protein
MSADNLVMIVKFSDGFRLAVIPAHWDTWDAEGNFLARYAEDLATSDVYPSEAATDEAAAILYRERVIEYGPDLFVIPMTFAEFYSAAWNTGKAFPVRGTCELCDFRAHLRLYEGIKMCEGCRSLL